MPPIRTTSHLTATTASPLLPSRRANLQHVARSGQYSPGETPKTKRRNSTTARENQSRFASGSMIHGNMFVCPVPECNWTNKDQSCLIRHLYTHRLFDTYGCNLDREPGYKCRSVVSTVQALVGHAAKVHGVVLSRQEAATCIILADSDLAHIAAAYSPGRGYPQASISTRQPDAQPQHFPQTTPSTPPTPPTRTAPTTPIISTPTFILSPQSQSNMLLFPTESISQWLDLPPRTASFSASPTVDAPSDFTHPPLFWNLSPNELLAMQRLADEEDELRAQGEIAPMYIRGEHSVPIFRNPYPFAAFDLGLDSSNE